MSERVAVTAASDAFHTRLRSFYALDGARSGVFPATDLAYCGSEFRVYRSMRIGDAMRFYGALHERWNAHVLAADLARAGLDPSFEVRRMKRTYQRALVLALALATVPATLVVEAADEFDDPPASALLESALTRVSRAVATYADTPGPHAPWFDRVEPAGAFARALEAAAV